jgi:hypothetical protein
MYVSFTLTITHDFIDELQLLLLNSFMFFLHVLVIISLT